MKKIINILFLILIFMATGCLEEKFIEQHESDNDISGERITINVGFQNNDVESKVQLGGTEGLELKWNEEDKLCALAFDETGNYIGKSDFKIQSDCAGTEKARFDGNTVPGAHHYILYYKTSGLTISDNGEVSIDYSVMVSDGRNSFDPLESCLLLQTNEILASELKTSSSSLIAKNSIMLLSVSNYPGNLGDLNAVDWVVVDAGGKERSKLRLHYTGKTSIDGSKPDLNGLYMCFDPAQMSLKAGEKFRFRIIGTAGRNFTSDKQIAKEDVVLLPGYRYKSYVTKYNEPFADIADIYFDKSGAAHDLSEYNRGVDCHKDRNTWVAFPNNIGYNALAAYFNHTFSAKPLSGTYTFPDYGLTLHQSFTDGYSLEAYVMCNVYPEDRIGEAVAFGSYKNGGTALMMSDDGYLSFLICGAEKVKPADVRSFVVKSDVKPIVGHWYHMVGAWDKENKTIRCFVDGELKGEQYVGDLDFVSSDLAGNAFWTIGANSSGGDFINPRFDKSWNGAVAQPRIYSTSLTSGMVSFLYDKIKSTDPSPVEMQHYAPEADMLNIVFNADGSATDISPMKMIVENIGGSSHVNYYNSLYKRNVARFTHTPGSTAPSSFYKINYDLNNNVNDKVKCQSFIDKLKDGHSLEVLFSTSERLDGNSEVKMFSSTERGGVSFLVSGTQQGNSLTYLPNISKTGASNWIWTSSGINPQTDRYVHLVGVWDKQAKKTRIYVDGMKKSEMNADGELLLPSDGSKWFAIGGDPSGADLESAWSGDVVIARIYDAPLTDIQVSSLYEKVKLTNPIMKNSISLHNVEYLSSCKIAPLNKYYVYAEGLDESDTFFLDPEKPFGNNVFPDSKFEPGRIVITIPSYLESGKYRLMLRRGDEEYKIGSVDFIVDAGFSPKDRTKVVAHRCYHKNYPANSLKAFKDTENRNIWGAEIDVHITSDGEVVVDHNGYLHNRWDDAHRFSNHTWKEISKAHPDVSRLDDFLTSMIDGSVPYLNMILEIKDQANDVLDKQLVDKCFELINRKPELKSRISWIAFDLNVCKHILNVAKRDDVWPDCMVMYLYGNLTPGQCKSIGIEGIDYSANRLYTHVDWISEAHGLGMKVNVWTVNSLSQMSDFICKGVDFITTDNPDDLKNLLTKVYVSE